MDGRTPRRPGERTKHKQMKRRWRTRLWGEIKAARCEKKKKIGNQNGEVWREESERQIKVEVLVVGVDRAKSRAVTQKQH